MNTLGVPFDEKLEGLRAKIETLLTAHGVGTPIVSKRVTNYELFGMESMFDFDQIFGNPIFWARIAPVDLVLQPTGEQPNAGWHGYDKHVESIDFVVLLEFEYSEPAVDEYDGSTTQTFHNLLFGQSPIGLLSYFNGNGGFKIAAAGSGDLGGTVELKPPTQVIIPEFPISATGDRSKLVHYAEFRVTVT